MFHPQKGELLGQGDPEVPAWPAGPEALPEPAVRLLGLESLTGRVWGTVLGRRVGPQAGNREGAAPKGPLGRGMPSRRKPAEFPAE